MCLVLDLNLEGPFEKVKWNSSLHSEQLLHYVCVGGASPPRVTYG